MVERKEINHIIDVSIIIIEALMVLLMFEYEVLLFSIFALLTMGLFRYVYSSIDRLQFVLAFTIGPVCELLAVYRGAWEYNCASYLVFPIWLPFAWGFVVLSITRLVALIK